MRTWTSSHPIVSRVYARYARYARPLMRARIITTRYCDVANEATNGIYEPFFELYVRAVCMKPLYEQPGKFECLDNIPVPPMDTQMEIVDAIQLYQLVIDIDPIQGLLVRLMLLNNSQGVQKALEAITDHYEAIDTLQQLSNPIS